MYNIWRHYTDFNKDRDYVMSYETLEEAQAHCRREDTHCEDWFDGYEEARNV